MRFFSTLLEKNKNAIKVEINKMKIQIYEKYVYKAKDVTFEIDPLNVTDEQFETVKNEILKEENNDDMLSGYLESRFIGTFIYYYFKKYGSIKGLIEIALQRDSSIACEYFIEILINNLNETIEVANEEESELIARMLFKLNSNTYFNNICEASNNIFIKKNLCKYSFINNKAILILKKLNNFKKEEVEEMLFDEETKKKMSPKSIDLAKILAFQFEIDSPLFPFKNEDISKNVIDYQLPKELVLKDRDFIRNAKESRKVLKRCSDFTQPVDATEASSNFYILCSIKEKSVSYYNYIYVLIDSKNFRRFKYVLPSLFSDELLNDFLYVAENYDLKEMMEYVIFDRGENIFEGMLLNCLLENKDKYPILYKEYKKQIMSHKL